jgi:hypothetical protein
MELKFGVLSFPEMEDRVFKAGLRYPEASLILLSRHTEEVGVRWRNASP